MFKQDLGFYLGNEKVDGFSGFVDENNLFLAVEIESGITPDAGRELTTHIREKIKTKSIENLHDFDAFISSVIQEKNLPSGFSFAVGYLKENIFYLKTVNQGKIFIRRESKMALLVEGDQTASGYIKEEDILIFTFERFMKLLGGESALNNEFDHRPVTDLGSEITSELINKDDQGTAALFLKLGKIEEDSKPSSDFFEKPGNLISFNLKEYYRKFGQQKTLTFITVFILGIMLFWSVGLGTSRRINENNQKKINLIMELILQKLSQAEEVAFLNTSSAMQLINDSKEEINKLKNEIHFSDKSTSATSKQINELDKLVNDSENKIIKKEDKKFTEFYDLTLDDKNAKGDGLYLWDDNLLIKDKSRGVIYSLSLEKKSLDKSQSSEIKKSTLIALFEENKYFYVPGQGVYQITENKPSSAKATEGEVKKLIDNDKDWGKVIDISVFNGNMYLLDQGKDEIWKYVKTEDGFGGKNSYFESGQAIDLSQIYSMSIDGSVYLAGDSVMFKYTSGLRDGFKSNLPDKSVNMNKIFTNKETEKVYGWDKDKETVYIMNKNGDYQEQVNSEKLSTGSDIVVYKNSIFVLQGSKIYKIE